MDDFTLLTAEQLSYKYQTRTASPVTVAEQVLAKIDRVNPKLNAFCFTDPETTLRQAQASEYRWSQSVPLSELDGVPVAIKDSILTQGWPTRHGSRAIDPDQLWLEDAPAVARLREAGAVFVGKTTMSEFGYNAHTSNSLLYGPVINPNHAQASTGGSSGGSAVAVAAKLVPVALATDMGGSIAVPSAWCGVLGYKPSQGIVPQWPMSVFETNATGIMARAFEDITLTLNTIGQPDWRDGLSPMAGYFNFGLNATYNGSNKKIACVGADTSTEYAVKILENAGCKVDHVSVDTDFAIVNKDLLERPISKQMWASIPEEKKNLVERQTQHWILNCSNSKEQTVQALTNRYELIARSQKLMQVYDFLISPAANGTAFAPASGPYLSPTSIYFAMTKQPTVTLPVGFDNVGMPISVTLAGKHLNDNSLLNFANWYYKSITFFLVDQ